jgi:hypothetical protein
LRGVSKSESSSEKTPTAQRGYRVFEPGDYVYDFELPLDSHLPETIEVESGSVKYELKAIVERAGAFCADLVGSRDVILIRTPAEGSLEQSELITIDRNWKGELHVEVVIFGKSFPLGAQIPISCRLTTQATVQFHWIKVFATEHIEYFCSNKRIHHMGPVRQIQLFEKWADVLQTSAISESPKKTAYGGTFMFNQSPDVSKVHTEKSMGLSSGLCGDASTLVTEMEVLAQLRSCHDMKDHDKSPRVHFDTTYRNIRVHHWLKVYRLLIVVILGLICHQILIRLSRSDPTDPNERKDFEIAINAPFRILSSELTEATTTLPAYSAL